MESSTAIIPQTTHKERTTLPHFLDTGRDSLQIRSVLAELPLNDASFTRTESVKIVADFLQNNSTVPGIILCNEDKSYLGAISRRMFFEALSKPFSLDLFYKKSIGNLLEMVEGEHLLTLPSHTSIFIAVEKALARRSFDEPIIVELPRGIWKVLDIYHLLLAHSHIHQLTVNALKEANELKSELMGIAAHDLKNPLGGIIGLSKILQSESGNDEHHEIAGQISELSTHMLKLVTRLLNSSAAEAGQLDLKLELTDIHELISAIVYQNHHQAESKGQHLAVEISESDEFIVNADALRMREAIENLLSNAIKYSPPGSMITIRLLKNNDILRFEVQDSGPGLTPEDLKMLFGKFRRLTAKPTGGESSTGLGLYISKQIIDLHGGKIYAESEVGNGSTFIIELPAVSLE